ncbi:MAG: putative baseplate assembly protein [Bacteroidales bacterium]
MSTINQHLDARECCEGITYLTPASVENLPGLASLVYRTGTFGSFKTSMQTGISSKAAITKLTSRDNDDPAVALLDSWATVLDILTFYQERIANEGYLNTATQRRSALELSRHISYKLSPGVAAGTHVAFTMDESPGAPAQAVIHAGTKVQSIPGQDELPQVFESTEEIVARKDWNTIKPRLSQPQNIVTTMESIILAGTTTNINPGDILLIKNGSARKTKKVLKISLDQELDITRIDFENPVLSPAIYVRPVLPEGTVKDLENDTMLNSVVIDHILSRSWKEEALSSLLKIKGWKSQDLVDAIQERLANIGIGSDKGVYIMRQKASVFGYNATKQVTYNTNGFPNPPSSWAEWSLSETNGKIFLDNAYDKILPESFIVIKKLTESVENATNYKITEVNSSSRTEYGISSKTTQLSLTPSFDWNLETNDLSFARSLTAYVQSEQQVLAEVSIEDLIMGDTLTLNGPYPGLTSGQKVIITGELADLNGIYNSEMKIIDEVILEAGFTVLTFQEALENKYIRDTVTINANVAHATHGETKTETLGSGNGSKIFQQFVLKQSPLTYTSAASASGGETTLTIRVNDVLWKEVPTLYEATPNDKVYTTRIDDDGKVTVQFGDGKTGARLPTGTENVKATYRVGTGLNGLLEAGQLSQLMTPKLGVKEVKNPMAPSGGADAETLDNARQNAPLTVLTLDRIVSMQDYEDFALAFAGIGKARADILWSGEQRIVHITIASADGKTIDESSDLYTNLKSAIEKARHANHLVQLESFVPLFFDVKAKVIIDSDYIAEKTLALIKETLQNAFSFDVRSFGQSVTPAEVTSVIQGVEGVIAVDLDKLNGEDPFGKEHFRLPAKIAHWDKNIIVAAELLTINSDGIEINQMSA